MSLYDDFEPRKPKGRRRKQKRSHQGMPPKAATPTADKQAPRLKITVQRPDQLDALAAKLGLSKAAVFNLALAELAERHGLG